MNRFLRISALACMLTPAAAQPTQQADLAKLNNAKTGGEEAARLSGCDGKEKVLVRYRLLRCPQSDGSLDLHLLLTERDYHFESSYKSPDEYDDEGVEDLFRAEDQGGDAPTVPAIFTPDAHAIHDSVVLVFDSKGKEVRPFGGNNFINDGFVFDFNGDGILERADSTNYSVKEAPKHSIESFKLQTVEREPRTLLEVIFNWHPRHADDANDWTFTCFDEDGDGMAEIAFGPEDASSDRERRQFVFRWNQKEQAYASEDIPEHSHIRVVKPGETYAAVARDGALGYPLIEPENNDSNPFNETDDSDESKQKRFVYESLKGATDEQLATFFNGKEKRDPHFGGPEDNVSTNTPDGLWDLDSKQAALAMADANRTASHRAQWKIAVDDRNGLTPPDSGWLIHDWSSSGCYSLSTHLIGLHFGTDDPVLVVLEYNSIGVVGRNPWADQPAHAARLIPLKQEEARFLADTIFWLDRIRAWTPSRDEDPSYSGSSTADGFASIDLIPKEGRPRRIASSTVWATSSIAQHWGAKYDREIFINLVEQFLGEALPDMLGKRWDVAPEVGHHSLTTPTGQRLKDRVDDNARQQLEETLTSILQLQPPAQIIRDLAYAAGEEALTELLVPLDEIRRSLPAPNAEDDEFNQLRERFRRDHFGERLKGDLEDDEKALTRLELLREKRRFDRGEVLRKPLKDATEKLRLAGNPARLIQAVADETPQAIWALRQLRRADIDAWAELISDGFGDADAAAKRQIFETLAGGHPEAARRLAKTLSPKERRLLILELTAFHQEHDPPALAEDIPLLFALVRDRANSLSQRGSAMVLLSEIELPKTQHDELHSLLLEEIENPQSESSWSTRSVAIQALTDLPGSQEDIDPISSLPSYGYSGFESAVEAVIALTPKDSSCSDPLARMIRARFQGNPAIADGMMNDVFFTALAMEVRDLAKEIQDFATESAHVQDGEYATSASSAFKDPKGERYHSAREVTALWSETDPATLGRMWIFFTCARPYDFDKRYATSATSEALRIMAEEAIRRLPKDTRSKTIDTALTAMPVPSHLNHFTPWLRSLK